MCENEISVLKEDSCIRPQRPSTLNLPAACPGQNCSDDEEIDVVDEGSDSDDDPSGIQLVYISNFILSVFILFFCICLFYLFLLLYYVV